jgi:tetratricopeptide (TPR) repeat protein
VSYINGYDPDTLRELVDLRDCRDRLDEIGEQRSLPALLERVWLLKVLDRLDDALVVAEQAVRQARMAGTRKDLLRARILHATVMQFRGAYAAADQELTTCAEEAEGQGWSGIAAFAYQHRGKVNYDAGDYSDARTDFKRALFLRQESGAPDDQLESTLLAIDAADRRRVEASVAS